MIRNITEVDGALCLIFDADLLAATGLKPADVVEVVVMPDGGLLVTPVATTTLADDKSLGR